MQDKFPRQDSRYDKNPNFQWNYVYSSRQRHHFLPWPKSILKMTEWKVMPKRTPSISFTRINLNQNIYFIVIYMTIYITWWFSLSFAVSNQSSWEWRPFLSVRNHSDRWKRHLQWGTNDQHLRVCRWTGIKTVTFGSKAGQHGTGTLCMLSLSFTLKQVDRSPTGSGVTARVALQYHKGLLELNQTRAFKSSTTGSVFTGKAVRVSDSCSCFCVSVLLWTLKRPELGVRSQLSKENFKAGL